MSIGTSHGLPGALPRQTSGFVGREAELARLRELLRRSRLITVTGTAGVGKTRLAIRAATELAAGFRDGAHLADVSALSDPALLAPAVAARLAAPGGAPNLEALLAFVRGRELLLILDTCEHLAGACAELAAAVLGEAPGVTILVTSRQPLGPADEAVLRLSPLPAPGAAVELFAQRAAATVPGFAVTEENRADVIAVCRRLDGIPLAIELATIRLRALPLHEMAGRITDRLRLLTGGRRSVTPRHQTLRAAVEWSYTLCTAAEKTLWARLSVFAGAFDLAAAQAVGAEGGLSPGDIESLVHRLADKSVLAQCDDSPGTFRMLGTLREFGAERLRAADGPAEAVSRGRHVAHYLSLAERFDQSQDGDQLGRCLRLQREHANLRAAFEYALSLEGNNGAAVVLATSLALYWRVSGRLREGEYWLDRALGRCPPGSVARARVLATRAYLRVLLGDFGGGRADAEAALALAVIFSDLAVSTRAACALHRAQTFSGDLAEAQAAGSAAGTFFASVGDVFGLGQLAAVDAVGQLQAGQPRRCHEIAAAALARLAEHETWCTSDLLGVQSVGLFLCGDFAAAKAAGQRGLALKRELRDVLGIAFALGGLAFVAAAEGRAERVAGLFGASAPLWEQVGRWYTGAPAFEALHQVAERAARARLGEERFWQLHGQAAAAPLAGVLDRALSDADQLAGAG